MKVFSAYYKNIYRILLIFVFVSYSFSQSRVGGWDSYTSSLNVNDIIQDGNYIYCATSGGLLSFNIETKGFNKFGIKDGFRGEDLNCTEEDEFGNFWLGLNAPYGEINIWNPESGQICCIFNEDDWTDKLTAFYDFAFYNGEAFAACQRNVEYGILHFVKKGSEYEYKDFYFNYPIDIFKINSLDIIGDTLWLSASSGLLYAKISETVNLKDKSNWNVVPFGSQDYVSNVIEYKGSILANFGSDFYKIEAGNPALFSNELNKDINSFSKDTDDNLITSTNRGVYFFTETGSWKKVCSDNVSTTISDSSGSLWCGTLGSCLLHLSSENNSTDFSETRYIPNTILDNGYTALHVDEDGILVAGSPNGISILTENGWHNIYRTIDYISVDDYINDNWSGFIADTIAFSPSGRMYSIVKRSDGTYFASLHGSYQRYLRPGALLRFDSDNIEAYIVYDTTDGRLSASEGVGTGTAEYIVIGYMVFDGNENLWICNRYAQNDNVIAILSSNDEWYHFSIGDSYNRLNHLLTSIAFDSENRVWFSSEAWSGNPYSNGGIIVLDYNNTLEDKSDDKWIRISNSDGLSSNSVFSIAFDQDGELWILTSGGVQRAVVSPDFPNRIFSYIEPPVLASIPFSADCNIKVDKMNNKWISTVSSGVKVYTYDGIWLNDVEGFTIENSAVLSDRILDIAFYPPEGIVYISTAKGISVYKSPYAIYGNEYKHLKIFPMPFKIPSSQPLVIDGLLQNSEVKITTIEGTFIRHLYPRSGAVIGQQAFWDGKSHNGDYVSSGVYLCFAYTLEGKEIVEKIVVVRK